jgi:hypothetical protein
MNYVLSCSKISKFLTNFKITNMFFMNTMKIIKVFFNFIQEDERNEEDEEQL